MTFIMFFHLEMCIIFYSFLEIIYGQKKFIRAYNLNGMVPSMLMKVVINKTVLITYPWISFNYISMDQY